MPFNTYRVLILLFVLLSIVSLQAVTVVAPPNSSYGRWHAEYFRNADRLLLMTGNDVIDVRNRILQGDPLFADIYSNNFTDRDGGVIGGIYQNALSSPGSDRSQRAVLAKNKAFVALIGIGVDPSGTLYLMSESEKNVFRDQALALLANFNQAAWSSQSRDLITMLSQINAVYDLQYRSRELICYLQAYDLLRPIGAERAWETTIARRLIQFASNIYFLANYWGSYFAYNNHRIITGSALGMAAILFGDWGVDTDNFADADVRSYMPLAWAGYGMININTVLYNYQVYADGGYNEGPHYLRYSLIYALPYFKAMKKFGEVFGISDPGQPAGDWTEDYITNPNAPYNLRSPWFGRAGDAHPDIWDVLTWITKIRQPEGRLPGIGSTFNDSYFPETAIAGSHFFWPQVSFESWIGDKDILNWALSDYSDSRADFIAAGNLPQQSPAAWEKMQVFPQTGDIVFRSGWGLEDIYFHVYAKPYVYGTSDFHREPHLQDDNSSFLLGFKKQVLALDAGYISWADRDQVDNADNHNLILVQNVGPSRNSTTAQIESYQKGEFFNYARIRTGYENVTIRREFLFCNQRYFIIKDRVDGSTNKVYQFLLHGNDPAPLNEPGGVTWQHENVSLKALITTNGGKNNLVYYLTDDIHDNGYGLYRTATHKRLAAGIFTTDTQFLSVLFPYDNTLPLPPEIVDIPQANYAALFVDGTSDYQFGNRFDFIFSRWPSSVLLTIPENTYGSNSRIIKSIKTDADFLVLSVDPANPDDPNLIEYFTQGMTLLEYGPYILFPQVAPVVPTISDQTVNEMDTLEVALSATDPEWSSSSFTAENLPPFGQLTDHGDGTAVIRFAPDYLAAGIYNQILVRITDSGEPPLSVQRTFTLTVQNVNLPPTAAITSNLTAGTPPLLVFLYSTTSIDPDGNIQSHHWEFDDGQIRTTANAVNIYGIAGIYHIVLTVTDNEGAIGRDTLTIRNHPDLSQLFISEVSYADQPYGEFLEIFNNAAYAINLREFKLVGWHSQGYLKYVFDFGKDEVDPESAVIIPSRQLLLVGREADKTMFADYWQLAEELIHFNSGDDQIIFGVPPSRWQLRYFDGTPDVENGTLIDDTEVSVAGLERRSTQFAAGQWRTTSYLEATPGSLDGDQSLAVELTSFTVQTAKDALVLVWETKSELDHVGFNILRSEIKDSLYDQIASYVDYPELAGEGNSSSGATYRWPDRTVKKNVTYWYKLADIDLSGRESEHGPWAGKLSAPADNMFLIDMPAAPDKFQLHHNFPNPFNGTISVYLDIPDLKVRINV